MLACPLVVSLCIVDHAKRPQRPELPDDPRVEYFCDSSNPGYGSGHNFAIRRAIDRSDYHLVINPDIDFGEGCLEALAGHLDAHPRTGALMPRIDYDDGRVQNLGRLLPSPGILFVRRFLYWLPFAAGYYRDYELFNIPARGAREAPNLSGSFLLLRNSALRECGLFDERYFLYCEDLDLVRRIHEKWNTEVAPFVAITHHHARESYHDFRMTLVHAVSAIRYFNKWGWFRDRRRAVVNRKTLRNAAAGRLREPGRG